MTDEWTEARVRGVVKWEVDDDGQFICFDNPQGVGGPVMGIIDLIDEATKVNWKGGDANGVDPVPRIEVEFVVRVRVLPEVPCEWCRLPVSRHTPVQTEQCRVLAITAATGSRLSP